MKRFWKIDVPGEQGYSLAVITEQDDPGCVIDDAMKAGLFDDCRDADYASAEDITDDAYEMKFWASTATEL